jgi:surface antigen
MGTVGPGPAAARAGDWAHADSNSSGKTTSTPIVISAMATANSPNMPRGGGAGW